MREFFGERWPSGVCDTGVQVATPIGDVCIWCYTAIRQLDRGLIVVIWDGTRSATTAIHRECELRQIVGSVAHMEGRCRCQGGDEKRPVTPLEKRQDALDLWAWIESARKGTRDAASTGRAATEQPQGGDHRIGPVGEVAGPDVRNRRTHRVPDLEGRWSAGSEDQERTQGDSR